MKTLILKNKFWVPFFFCIISFVSVYGQGGCSQCKNNKVKMNLCVNGFWDYCESCTMKCVQPSQVANYLSNGWSYGVCPHACGGNQRLAQNSEEDVLLSIYPNPIQENSIISFPLDAAGKISLQLFDISGRLVATILDATMDEGYHEIPCNVSDVKAGIYFLKLQTGDEVRTEKISIIN